MLEGLFPHGREAQIRALYRKGNATSREILETEFGHWPPNGINVTSTKHLDKTVELKSHFEDNRSGAFDKFFNTVATLGYVYGKETMLPRSKKNDYGQADETIFFNPVLMGTIGKAGAAFLAYTLASRFIADLSLTGALNFLLDHELLSLMVFATSLRHLAITQIFTHPFHSYSDVIGHEHIHILQIHDKKRAKTGYDMDQDHFKDMVTENSESFSRLKKFRKFMDNVFSFGTSRYLLNDVEVQARLHTVMVHGYHRWGRLPENRQEFIAACVDSGLKVHPAIRKEADLLPQEVRNEFIKPGLTGAFMRAARDIISNEVGELNAAHRAIMDENLQYSFWDETLPYMYGHLLELYGDKKGRHKMGWTKLHDEDGPIPLQQILPPPSKETAATLKSPPEIIDMPEPRYGT